ncbi:MAG: 2-oxoglutarate/2-oxoacid ferredoxin oxidoreductase subunit alpha [Clostridia bacterium]|nr:2-oxoglutarate/2-oxoacid ferredoxin oxidoreductase subunit alpha [Clostridia bacterium]
MDKKIDWKLMQGNEACAAGAVKAGMRFFAGYPISPASEIAHYLAKVLPRIGGVFIQMEDEIASIAAVIGASIGGVKAMTATSGPGFSLMQENIGFAAMAEVPCVIVNVQRLGPSTGCPTYPAQGDVMQARWGTHGDHPIVVLSPSTVTEVYQLTIKAFNFAEILKTPVILLLDEIVAHMREGVNVHDLENIEVLERKPCDHRFHITGLYHDETGFPTTDPRKIATSIQGLHQKIAACEPYLSIGIEEGVEEAEVIVLAYGCSARPATAAVRAARSEGLKVGLVRPMVLWPFPEKIIANLASRVQAIIVPEMNLGQLVLEVERAAGGKCRVLKLSRTDGQPFTPEEILTAIKREVSSCPNWRLRPIYDRNISRTSGAQVAATA